LRDQFCHVIDVVPTILEATKMPAPEFVDGIQQQPIEGISFAYSFDDAKAADRHTTQISWVRIDIGEEVFEDAEAALAGRS
jgi:arylsulfatase A-like enzyme